MTEPYIGEIQLFGFDFNPVGWALCNGATLPLQQNTTLYSLSASSMAVTARPRFNCRTSVNAPAASRGRARD